MAKKQLGLQETEAVYTGEHIEVAILTPCTVAVSVEVSVVTLAHVC